MNVSVTRKPWAVVVVTLIFGPVIGMMYLNKGRIALVYMALSLCSVILVFAAAHAGILTCDPRIAAPAGEWLLKIIGAFHGYRIVKNAQPMVLKWYAQWYNMLLLFGVIAALAMLLRWGWFEPFDIPASSMEPGINRGDHLFVDKRAYDGVHLPARGDVIVFKVRTEDAIGHAATVDYIKRIVGLPGDKIEIAGRTVSINGTVLPEQVMSGPNDDTDRVIETLPEGQQIALLQDKAADLQNMSDGAFDVPPGSYFVMGDYRTHSIDSRNKLGYILAQDVKGKAVLIYWNEQTYKFSYRHVE